MGAGQQPRAQAAPTIVPGRDARQRRADWRAIPTASISATASPSSPATGAVQSFTSDRASSSACGGSSERPARRRRRRAPVGHGRGRARPLRGHRLRHRDRRPAARSTLLSLLGDAGSRRRGRARSSQHHRTADFDERLARQRGELGRLPRHAAGRDAGRGLRPHGQSLAALPEPRLPHPRALGLLPGKRRLRLPRPAAGHAGAAAARPVAGARADPQCRRAGSSPKATSSTGGCRAPAPACAR